MSGKKKPTNSSNPGGAGKKPAGGGNEDPGHEEGADDSPNDDAGGDDEEGDEGEGSGEGEGEGDDEGHVSRSAYDKLLKQRKADRDRFKALEDELKKLRGNKNADETKRAKEANDYKKLAELKEQELEELRAENETLKGERDKLNSRLSDGLKLRSFLDELPGSLDRRYFTLIDLDDVVMDPETNQPDPASVKKAAQKFAKEYPELMKKGSKTPPGDAARNNASGSKIKYEDWLKLPLDEMKKRRKDVVD